MRTAFALGLVVVALFGVALPRASGGGQEGAPDPTAGVPPLRDLIGGASDAPARSVEPVRPQRRIRWRKSRAVGLPFAGRLRRGVQLPAEGDTYFTWDPIHKVQPNRAWRRWGTDRLIRTTLRLARRYAGENPDAPRLTIGDLSRPRGGDFGPQYGSIGHASHQNGLDIDIYYPRRDRKERPPDRPRQVDMHLSQELVDMFVAAGAEKVFVGPSLTLVGPPSIVQPLVHHDNHIHVRLPAEAR